MLDPVISWLLSWFIGPVPDTLTRTINSLEAAPSPDLASSSFKAYYAATWGIAVIIGIVLILWHVARALWPHPDNGEHLRNAVRVLLWIGLLAAFVPVTLFAAQVASGWLTRIAVSLADPVPEGASWFTQLTKLPNLEGPTALVASFFAWLISLALQVEAFLIEHLILIVGGLLLLAVILKRLPRFGERFLSVIMGLALVSVVSRPFMVLVLVLGVKLLNLIQQNTPLVAGLAFLELLILGLAAWTPIWFFGTYRKNFAHIVGGKSDVSGSRVNATGGGPSRATIAATAAGGGAALLHAVNTHMQPKANMSAHTPSMNSVGQPRQSSTVRRIGHVVLTNAGVKAAARSHPYVAIAAQVAAMAVKPKVPQGAPVSQPLQVPPPRPVPPPPMTPPTVSPTKVEKRNDE